MADAGSTGTDNGMALKLDTSPALQETGYDSLSASESGTSSEDEIAEAQAIPAEDARTAIGVSISPEQTRLTSPQTPAVEKAAALERAGGSWGSFDRTEEALVEEEAEEDDGDDEQGEPPSNDDTTSGPIETEERLPISPPTTSPRGAPPGPTEVQLPSPWRFEPDTRWQTGQRPKSGLFDGIFHRRRGSSGVDRLTEERQKSLWSGLPSLPSIPRPFSLSLPFSGSHDARQQSDADKKTTPERPVTPRRQRSESDSRMKKVGGNVVLPDPEFASEISRKGSVATVASNAHLLRRSTSDHSLTTQRTLSRTETLGDDSRFEDVSSQVNSRLKAVRDSFQDSHLRIPNLSNLKVPNFTPEFLRERAASVNKRQAVRHAPAANTADMIATTPRSIDPNVSRPTSSSKESKSAVPTGKDIPQTHFHRALQRLGGDVVVLGGYRGSILRSTEPPYRQVWVPMKVGFNMRKVNLEVGFDEDGDERATDYIFPDGMLTHIGPVDISRRLFKRLRACENARCGRLDVHDYGYDWRLSPAYLSKQLIQYLEKLPCNQSNVSKEDRGATVIAHSLGGLITRHAVNQRPELFKGVVYAGVPQTCVNILGPLRNGDEVILNDKVLTAQVNFSIRSSFALLPLDGRCFFDINTNEEYPVDFFDVNTWIDQRLSPCVNRPLPPLQPPPKPTGIAGYVSSITSAMPSLTLRARKDGRLDEPSKMTTAGNVVGTDMNTSNSGGPDDDVSNENYLPDLAGTTVTVPRKTAIDYLERTLASVKCFKQELAFDPKHAEANVYPPIAVIYGKTTPTVYGAKVNGRDGIKHSDAYDNLAFASGDGVVLARAAMAPEGYKPVRGGIVASDRGHVTLLGDLEALGKCLNAIIRSRKRGVGQGQ